MLGLLLFRRYIVGMVFLGFGLGVERRFSTARVVVQGTGMLMAGRRQRECMLSLGTRKHFQALCSSIP